MKNKITEFEETLRGVSEETLVVLEEKEAALRLLGAERLKEREAHSRGITGGVSFELCSRRGNGGGIQCCRDLESITLCDFFRVLTIAFLLLRLRKAGSSSWSVTKNE